jgi:hypothetical protein
MGCKCVRVCVWECMHLQVRDEDAALDGLGGVVVLEALPVELQYLLLPRLRDVKITIKGKAVVKKTSRRICEQG